MLICTAWGSALGQAMGLNSKPNPSSTSSSRTPAMKFFLTTPGAADPTSFEVLGACWC